MPTPENTAPKDEARPKRPRAPRAPKPAAGRAGALREDSQDLPGRALHVSGCLRCGNDHDITVHQLTHATPQGWDQWGLCPVFVEPVFFASPAQRQRNAEALAAGAAGPLPTSTSTPPATPEPEPTATPEVPAPRPVAGDECNLCGCPLRGDGAVGPPEELYYQVRYDIPNALGRQTRHYRTSYHASCYRLAGAGLAANFDAAGVQNFNLVFLATAAIAPRP